MATRRTYTKEEVHAKLEQLSGAAYLIGNFTQEELELRLANVQSQILPGVNHATPASDDPAETQGLPEGPKQPAVENPQDRVPADIDV